MEAQVLYEATRGEQKPPKGVCRQCWSQRPGGRPEKGVHTCDKKTSSKAVKDMADEELHSRVLGALMEEERTAAYFEIWRRYSDLKKELSKYASLDEVD